MAAPSSPPKKPQRLRLLAEDTDDLTVIAACLQDALAKVSEMTYLPGSRRFVLALSRYRWESEDAQGKSAYAFERVTCGLHFDSVRAVRVRGDVQARPETVLELLTIAATPAAPTAPTAGAGAGAEGATTITLLFSGDAAIQLDVECIDAALSDITTPWPVPLRPDHGPLD
jgi:hypothetical protein